MAVRAWQCQKHAFTVIFYVHIFSFSFVSFYFPMTTPFVSLCFFIFVLFIFHTSYIFHPLRTFSVSLTTLFFAMLMVVLVLILQDGTSLIWISSSGERRLNLASVSRIITGQWTVRFLNRYVLLIKWFFHELAHNTCSL